MRKSFLLFVFLLVAIFAFKFTSNDTNENLETPTSVELISDSDNLELAKN